MNAEKTAVNTGPAPVESFSLAKNNVAEAELWLYRAIDSLVSLWDTSKKTFRRHSEDVPDSFRPTASFQGFDALCDAGVFITLDGPAKTGAYIKLEKANAPPPSALLDAVISVDVKTTKFPAWLKQVYKKSSHTRRVKVATEVSPRETIVLAPLCRALNGVFRDVDEGTYALMRPLENGLGCIRDRLQKLLSEDTKVEANLSQSAAMLANTAECLWAIESLVRTQNLNLGAIDAQISDRLTRSLERHVDYHMARRDLGLDPAFDSLALCNALRGLLLVEPQREATSYSLACLRAISEAQLADGCWPDGASVTFEATGDVVQQPSLGIAMMLAESGVDNRCLVDVGGDSLTSVRAVLPALRRTARYLRTMHQTDVSTDAGLFAGWSSDRTRRKGFIETWITAMAVRFFFRLWIGERAALRALALDSLDHGRFQAKGRSAQGAEDEWQKLVDPDSVTRPLQTVFDNYVEPILEQKRKSLILQKPRKNGTSFILFGPPGSGKTFFVEKMAELLDWPLVNLTPGHFIRHGLDAIESTTREIFDGLMQIEHAVVFFDECDELFRERSSESGRFRSILSFATASMLPKLQALHDHGRVLFVVGTNYARNIDTAIRRPGRFDDILLYDRPDANAGRRILEARHVDAVTAENHSPKVSGLTYNEVVAYADAIKLGKTPPSENSLDDYLRWCVEDGPKELQATRLDSAKITRVTERWGEIRRRRQERGDSNATPFL